METPNSQSPAILQICLSSAQGGLEISTLKWAKFFHNRGYNSITLCLKNSYLEQELSKASITHYTVNRPSYFSIPVVLKLVKIYRTHKPTAVCVHLLRDLWHTFWLKKIFPEVRVFGYARMFLYGVNKKDFLHRLIYNQLSKLWVLTSLQIPTLLECLPIEREKIEVLPNGVDTKKFFPQKKTAEKIIKLRKDLGANPDNFLIGIVARISFQKGYREFIHAVKILTPKYPHLRFLIVGDNAHGETMLSEINQFVKEHSLSRYIKRVAFRTDIPDIMSALNLLVLPSYNEAFGNVLIEAMACETPVLGTSIGGIPEVLGNGKFGLLIKSESGQALADGIEKVICDPEATQIRVRTAQNQIQTNLGFEAVMERAEKTLISV